jgi:hypothetical protein
MLASVCKILSFAFRRAKCPPLKNDGSAPGLVPAPAFGEVAMLGEQKGLMECAVWLYHPHTWRPLSELEKQIAIGASCCSPGGHSNHTYVGGGGGTGDLGLLPSCTFTKEFIMEDSES